MNPFQLTLLCIAILGFGVATAAFGFLAPWYRSKTGVVLFSTILNLLVILVLSFVEQLLIDYRFEQMLINLVLFFTAINGIALSIAVLRIQIIGYRVRKMAESIVRGSTLPKDDFPSPSPPPQPPPQ